MKTHDSTGELAAPFWSEQSYSSNGNGNGSKVTAEVSFICYHPHGYEADFVWPWQDGYMTPADQRLALSGSPNKE